MQILRLSIFSTVLLAATACVSAPATAAPSSAPAVAVSPVPSPSPVAASPKGAATPALPPAIVDVSPADVQTGSLSLSLSMDRARHMLDQSTAMAGDPDAAHQTSTSAESSTGSTAYVLQGLLQLTNNFNPAQQIPDDEPQSMLRHLNLLIHSGAGTDSVPYLSTTMDLLLDGHAVLSNVPLVPMVAGEAPIAQFYYGNNVKLTQRGAYQVFVRILPNALLGKDPLPAAQFNVVVH